VKRTLIAMFLAPFAALAFDATPLLGWVTAGQAWTPASLSPVAWYRGDGNALDSSPNSRNGIWAGTATYATGVNGQALLTSSANYVTNINSVSSAISGATAVSVALWVMRGDINDRDTLLDLSIQTTSSKIFIEFQANNTFRAGGRAIPTDSFQSVITAGTLAHTNWMHLVTVFDIANDQILVYTNAVSAATSGSPSWSTNVFTSATGNESYLGAGALGTTPHEGRLDDVLIFNRALTPAEITQLYNWRQ